MNWLFVLYWTFFNFLPPGPATQSKTKEKSWGPRSLKRKFSIASSWWCWKTWIYWSEKKKIQESKCFESNTQHWSKNRREGRDHHFCSIFLWRCWKTWTYWSEKKKIQESKCFESNTQHWYKNRREGRNQHFGWKGKLSNIIKLIVKFFEMVVILVWTILLVYDLVLFQTHLSYTSFKFIKF